MRKIAFVNEKGGTGKTTLTINVGAWLARQGKRVLIIDMDPQGHVGKSLGLDIHRVERTVFDLLVFSDIAVADIAIQTETENLHIIPANKKLTDMLVNIAKHSDRHLKLKNKMDNISGYDFVLIDSPPSLGLLTVNILLACEEIVIPVSLTYLSLDGCAEILDTVKTVQDNFGHKNLRVSLVVPTFFEETILVKSIMNKLKNYFKGTMSNTVINFDMKLDQAQSFGKHIFDFDPESKGAGMMASVAKEVLERG